MIVNKTNKLIAILSICSLTTSFSQDIMSKTVKENLQRIEVAETVELFCTLLIENEINLNKSDNSNLIKLDIVFSDFNNKYDDRLKNTIALALGSNIDSLIKIDININLWDNLSKLEKVSTIFHELCHDLLNVKHVEGDQLNLMHPFAQPKSFTQLQIMFNKFIRDYKLSRVDLFKNGFYIHDMTKVKKPYLFNLNKT